MDPKVAYYLNDIPPHLLPEIAEELGCTVEDIRTDEGLAATAWGSHWLIVEKQNGGPSTDPGYARYIASQTMNPDGS